MISLLKEISPLTFLKKAVHFFLPIVNSLSTFYGKKQGCFPQNCRVIQLLSTNQRENSLFDLMLDILDRIFKRGIRLNPVRKLFHGV